MTLGLNALRRLLCCKDCRRREVRGAFVLGEPAGRRRLQSKRRGAAFIGTEERVQPEAPCSRSWGSAPEGKGTLLRDSRLRKTRTLKHDTGQPG